MDHSLTANPPVPRPRTGPEPNLGSGPAPDLGPGVPPPWFSAALLADAAAQLTRGRLRTAVALDAVTFTAACPACGDDAEWTEEREDTRLRARVSCDCAG